MSRRRRWALSVAAAGEQRVAELLGIELPGTESPGIALLGIGASIEREESQSGFDKRGTAQRFPP
jgi:hypothetical protein